MERMENFKSRWEELHKLPKFRPQYPSESVVRFLFANFPHDIDVRKNLKILDLGCGAGRHVKLFSEQGFDTYGTDFSGEGILQTKFLLEKFGLKAKLRKANMNDLSYEDNFFDGIISNGVFYYADHKEVRKSIDELYRVLKKSGQANIRLRATNDCRFGKGKLIDKNTFLLDIDETNEKDLICHFITKEDVYEYFSRFSEINLEIEEFSFGGLKLLNSDWVITVEK